MAKEVAQLLQSWLPSHPTADNASQHRILELEAELAKMRPSSLTEKQYKNWLKDLKLPQHKLDTLEKQLEKVTAWWQNQQDDAVKTIQRASVAMGIDPCKHKNAATDEIVLKVMTVAMLMQS